MAQSQKHFLQKLEKKNIFLFWFTKAIVSNALFKQHHQINMALFL